MINLVSINNSHIYNLNKVTVKKLFCFLKTVFVNMISPGKQNRLRKWCLVMVFVIFAANC